MNFLANISRSRESRKHISVFLDLRKAFDCVDHDILINKLKLYNFDEQSVKWFSSYLSNRTQKVLVRDETSDPGVVKCGVPQGSVLGPLLFTIHINDLVLHSKLSKNLFADDTTLQLSGDSIDNLEKNVKTELKVVAKWFSDNCGFERSGRCHLAGCQCIRQSGPPSPPVTCK